MEDKLKNGIATAIQNLLPVMGSDLKFEFLNTKEEDLHIFHFGFGTWIRNNILTEDSEIYRIFAENGFEHKDDMSSMIIRELYRYLWR